MTLRTDRTDGSAFTHTDANEISAEVNNKGRRSTTITAPGATPAINVDLYDYVVLNGLNIPITNLSTLLTGTPVLSQKLMLVFQDNGTAQAITYGVLFSNGAAQLLAVTVPNKKHHVGLVWDGTTFVCLASHTLGY